MKKYLINLGVIGTALASVVATVSCDSLDDKKSEDNKEAKEKAAKEAKEKAAKEAKEKAAKEAKEKAAKEAKEKAAKKLGIFKKRFNDVGANIDGKSNIQAIAKESKNIQEFKRVLLLAGAKSSTDKLATSGLKSLSTEALQAIYDFYKEEENEIVSLVKMLSIVTFKINDKTMNLSKNIGDIIAGLSNDNFLWISKYDKSFISDDNDTMKGNLEGALKAKVPVEISYIAENSKTLEEFIQGIIIMGGIVANDNNSSAGLLNMDYYKIKKIYDFYIDEDGDLIKDNKDKSITFALKKLNINLSVLKALPKQKFILTNALDLIGIDNGRTDISKIAMYSKDILSFLKALISAGAPTTDGMGSTGTRVNRKSIYPVVIGTTTYKPNEKKIRRNMLSYNWFRGPYLVSLYEFYKDGKNRKVGIDKALTLIKWGSKKKNLTQKNITGFLKLFKNELFVYQGNIK